MTQRDGVKLACDGWHTATEDKYARPDYSKPTVTDKPYFTIGGSTATVEPRFTRREYPETKHDPNLDKKKTCLLAAQAAVCGDRPLNYGNPENNFGRIAILWNAWNAVRRPGPYVGADVAIMMDLVKSARLANNPAHSDSWIDKAGYAACGYDIAAKD